MTSPPNSWIFRIAHWRSGCSSKDDPPGFSTIKECPRHWRKTSRHATLQDSTLKSFTELTLASSQKLQKETILGPPTWKPYDCQHAPQEDWHHQGVLIRSLWDVARFTADQVEQTTAITKRASLTLPLMQRATASLRPQLLMLSGGPRMLEKLHWAKVSGQGLLG